MIPKRRLIRIIVRKFWGACAFLLISLAVFVVIGRELSPKLNRYKDDLSTLLSEHLAVTVQINTMQVDWSGLSPQLSLTGVELINPAGDTFLSMGNALLRVDLLRSLVNGNFALDRLEASSVDLELTQNQQGVWGFRGVPWQTTANENFNIDDPLDVFLLIRRVDLTNVQARLNFRDGDQNQLNLPELSFANNGDFHRLNSSIVVDNQREAVSAIVEFRGDPRALNNFSAKGYTRFQDVSIGKVITALPGAWQDDRGLWNGRAVTLESWFDIFAGGETLFRGRLDVNGSGNNQVANEAGIKIPNSIGANFTGRLTTKGELTFALRDTVIDWTSFQAPLTDLQLSVPLTSNTIDNTSPSPAPIHLRAAGIELQPWLDTLQQSGLMQGRISEILLELAPQGRLQNIDLTIQPREDLPSFEFRANFDQFAISSWRGSPAATSLSGFVRVVNEADQIIKGEVQLNSENSVSLQFPSLYDNAMAFDGLTGQVNWQVDIEKHIVRVSSGLMSVKSAEGNARGYFDLTVPLGVPPGSEELILQLGMRDTPVKYYQKYVPSRLPRDLLNWLEQSLSEQGTIASSGFLYRGGLTPEGRKQSEFQLYADIDESNIRYHPDFPELKQASGQLWMDRFTVHGDINRGKLLAGTVQQLTFDITGDPAIKKRQLEIDGQIVSDAKDGLAVLQSDAFVPIVNRKLDSWQAQGNIKTRLQLKIPLQADQAKGQQNVAIQLNGVDLVIPEIKAEVKNIRGTIRYDSQNALTANNVTGLFFGKEISVDLDNNGNKNNIHLAIRGENSISELSDWAAVSAPSFLQGNLNYNVDVDIDQNAIDVQLRSDLVGTAIDLPQPFGKTESEPRAFYLQVPFGRQNTYWRMNYANELYGVFHLNNTQLRRGVLSTQESPALPQANQFLIAGSLEKLEFETWRDTFNQHFAGFKTSNQGRLNNLPLNFELAVGEFSLGDFNIDNLSLAANIRDRTTALSLDSETVAGSLSIPDSLNTPMLVDLQYLRLPKVERHPPSWSDVFFPPTRPGDALNDIDPSTLPPFDFSVQALYLGDQNLGKWTFNARPLATGLAVTNLMSTFAEGHVVGLQAEQGARVNWLVNDSGIETRVEGRFESNDLAAVLKKWNQPEMLQSEDATFDFSLRWPGAPTAIAVSALQGEVTVNMQKGSYYTNADQAAGGALFQLVSILNFDTWMRRLRLDFSDLGRRGLAYDNVEGLLRFDSGQVYLDQPLVMQTQSGEFQFTGLVDIENNALDARLTMTLPMGGNLTFLTALAAGLPAAAGVWVVSKIFDEQIDKVSTLVYTVDGSLDNPNGKFQRLSDDKNESNRNADKKVN